MRKTTERDFETLRKLYGTRVAWVAFIAGHILAGVFAALALVALLSIAVFLKHLIF